MVKNNVQLLTISLAATLIVSTAIIVNQNSQTRIFRGNAGHYTLLLDSNQKLTTSSSPSESEISHNVKTENNNNLSLSSFNIVNNELGWQTLLPNGYIYNPVTSSGTNNKLSGIQSIEYDGNGSLDLSYGYSLNNEEIIYSFSSKLTANTPYFFEESPNYFYIKNSGDTNVDIDSLTINYSCSAQNYPRNNLKVLMIGNSFADDTVYYAERIANSVGINIEMYDAYIGGCTINTHYENITSENPLTQCVR